MFGPACGRFSTLEMVTLKCGFVDGRGVGVIMEKIPDQVGYLVLTEDGAVLESGGELENDERVATIITDLVTLSNRVDSEAFTTNEQFKKISITYDDHWITICLSNKKIYVVKRNIVKTDAIEPNTVNV